MSCVHSHTSTYLFSTLYLWEVLVSQLPISSSRRKNSNRSQELLVSAWLLVLTRDLALLSHLTSLPLVPSLKKKDQKKLDLTRQDSSPQETSLGSVVEYRSSSPHRAACHSRNGAKCKGQTQTVTSDTPLLIFNLWKWFSWAPTTQLPVAGIKQTWSFSMTLKIGGGSCLSFPLGRTGSQKGLQVGPTRQPLPWT